MALPPCWHHDRLRTSMAGPRDHTCRVTTVIGPMRYRGVLLGGMLKPVELEIELFCRGMRIDDSCHTGEDGRRISRTRAGLGSGTGDRHPVRAEADLGQRAGRRAVRAALAVRRCTSATARYFVVDSRDGAEYAVTIPPEPAWYSRNTIARRSR